MTEMPVPTRPALRRLARRLALGLFLDVWPVWAVSSLLLSGLAAITCRLFFPGAAPMLPWLWLAPLLAVVPALVVCRLRAYRPDQVVALADWLAGGRGLLLTLHEKIDDRWADTALAENASRIVLPRPRAWRRLAPLVAALCFLGAALWLPQRTPAASQEALADEIAGELAATLAQVKQQALVTPEEEQKMEEEIERIRRDAGQQVDAASWEAADAVKERLVADLAAKQDALKWADESLARLAAGGSDAGARAAAQTSDLAQALQALAKSGLLAGAPEELQRLARSGRLPADAKALAELTASLSKYLGEARGRLGTMAKLGKEFGRFNPDEFPLASCELPGNKPGRGGIDRGRADAELTWGKESPLLDRFKATPLPPGAPRNPDDWAPLVELPGAPRESAVLSTAAAARQYEAAPGYSAWRRTLAPRHQSALKKYFAR